MFRHRLSSLLLSLCFLCVALAAGTTTTTVVSVTSTKTAHVTSTNYSGACDNFVGACVVYGTNAGAPYTTTVYIYDSSSAGSTSVFTSTETFVATTTASNSAACSGFSGACVVYGGASSTSTVYAGNSPAARPGNHQGYIGPKQQNQGGAGFIGGAVAVERWALSAMFGIVLAVLVYICA